MGEVIRNAGVKIFQIETTLNNDTFPKPFDFLQKPFNDETLILRTTRALEQDERIRLQAGDRESLAQRLESLLRRYPGTPYEERALFDLHSGARLSGLE